MLSKHTDQKASLLLISGFLGAGKTTLLKQILSWERDLSDTVVVVNEFGEVGIDGALLEDAGSDVVELTSGCICCTLRADLKQSLARIWNRFHPARILIESSGVADPTALFSVLNDTDLNNRMRLSKTITVLDGDFWSARDAFGALFYNQLEAADLILLNKIDLLAADEIPSYLKEIHERVPGAQVIPTVSCGVDPETLWAEPKSMMIDLKPFEYYQSQPQREAVIASQYQSFSFHTTQPLDEKRFKAFCASLPFELFRMKGPVRLPNRTVMVNDVGGQNNWSPWTDEAETRLVFIGWNVDKDRILEKLNECVIPI